MTDVSNFQLLTHFTEPNGSLSCLNCNPVAIILEVVFSLISLSFHIVPNLLMSRYVWFYYVYRLLTPPDTPLFPSLEAEEVAPVNLARRGRPRSQPISISRSSTVSHHVIFKEQKAHCFLLAHA